MTPNQIYSKMIATASALSVDQLQVQVKKYMADTSEGAGIVFNVLLTALEEKMDEGEYIDFCDAL